MPNFSIGLSVAENGRKKPEYTLESDLSGELTLQDLIAYTKAALIVIADQVLTEEQALGFDKEPVLVVDGSTSKSIKDVSPFGRIEFRAREDLNQIFIDAYDYILDRSKVLTGRYKASHYVFYNGRQVATDLQTFAQWLGLSPPLKDGDVVRIVNIQPYARRLETLGVTAQRTQSSKREKRKKGQPTGKIISVPNGTYVLAARALKSKYKRNVAIAFAFLPGSSLGLTGSFKGGRHGKNSAGRAYLYPSITITVSERGTT